MFSPSQARANLAQAKDWNYIDTWLSTRLGGKPAPPFERNAETLKALLALAAWNENADEEQQLLERVKRKVMNEWREREKADANLHDLITSRLQTSSKAALETLAQTSYAVSQPLTTLPATAQSILNLTTQAHVLAVQERRVDTLQSILNEDLLRLKAQLSALQTPAPKHFTTGLDDDDNLDDEERLHRQTQGWIRGSKALAPKLSEYRERIAGFEKMPQRARIEDVCEREAVVLKLRERVAGVDAQVRAFEGLPVERGEAIKEVEGVRREVRQLERVRDGMFEELVEKGW